MTAAARALAGANERDALPPSTKRLCGLGMLFDTFFRWFFDVFRVVSTFTSCRVDFYFVSCRRVERFVLTDAPLSNV